jgi:hypothetical protein
VLIGDDLPELGTDLVAALAGLDVNEFAHYDKGVELYVPGVVSVVCTSVVVRQHSLQLAPMQAT